MRIVAKILLGFLLTTYAMVWSSFALLMLVVWEAPKSWIDWSVIVFNPVVLIILLVSISRFRERTTVSG